MRNETKRVTPMQAIRKKCLDCSCWSWSEVKQCELSDCALYPFRLGRNPNIGKREMTEAQRQAARERLALAREKKTSADQREEVR